MGRRLKKTWASLLVPLCLALWAGCAGESPPPIATLEVDVPETVEPRLLRTIMIGLGVDMKEISRGLWLEDLATVDSAANAIAEHPHVSDSERIRIQGILGADFAGFIKGDRRVHDSAMRLSVAAAAGDMTAALAELATLQANCVVCHQDYRERLR